LFATSSVFCAIIWTFWFDVQAIRNSLAQTTRKMTE
jgi:hypothetical protein